MLGPLLAHRLPPFPAVKPGFMDLLLLGAATPLLWDSWS